MRIVRLLLILLFVAALCIAGVFLQSELQDDAPAAGTADAEQVRLNEVMTSNNGAVLDDNGNDSDWIELYNGSDGEVDISGYGLSDSKATMVEWAFPAGTRIPAKGYLVVFCSGDADGGPLHIPFKLSANEDLILTGSGGKLIESLALVAVAPGATMARDEQTGTWGENAAPTPGYPNTEAGAAAYRESLRQSIADNGVRIGEYMVSNATTLPGGNNEYPDWVELYNTTDADADLSGCGFSDDLNRPKKWTFPEGTVIPAHGALLIHCSGQAGLVGGQLHAPFALNSYAGDIALADRRGNVLDSVSYTEQQTDISMARVPGGIGEWRSTVQPTPGYPNTEEGLSAFRSANALPKGAVRLSEVMGNNAGSYKVESSTPDWIELCNSSDQPVNLSGYGLSDNPKNPAMWQFPDVTIAAGGYLVVLATGNDVRQGDRLETNFGISAAGDVVLLFSPQGELLDKLQMAQAGPDISYGRTQGELLYYATPTPGAANGQGSPGVTGMPAFSALPGVYESAVTLELYAQPGETVYYTTDSTTPTEGSTRYDRPITIDRNTVVRAMAVREGYLTGGVATGTFLFKADDADHQLPIVTLVTDPKNLWDDKTGIYAYGENYDPDLPLGDALLSANYYKGRSIEGEEAQTAWERPASFAVFADDTARQAFSQDVSIRIAGGYGRSRAQKGFNIIARSQHGSNSMDYAFFANRPYTAYKSVALRAGAQDQNRSKIRDELSMALLEGSDVNFIYQAYKPYVLYLNGEYWGVYFLKEKRSRFFVAQHESTGDADNMDLLKASSRVSHGSNEEWLDLMQYVSSHDLSRSEHYSYVTDRVDVNSFMDYMICELYVGNSDYANIQYYKLPGGKWKWIYFDFCWGWNDVDHKTLTLRRGDKPAGSTLFNALLKNPQWRDAFCRRFAELMKTVYAPQRVDGFINELYAAVEPEIRREREKFNGETFMGGQQLAEALGSYDSFQRNIESIRKFAQERPAVIRAQLKSEFGLSDAYMRELFGE